MHWVIMFVLSFVVASFILLRKKYKTYCGIILCLAVFMVFFLLDAAVGIRFSGVRVPNPGIDLSAEYDRLIRLIHGSERLKFLMFLNLAAYVPFGFFIMELITETKQFDIKHRFGYVIMWAFLLSLSIELLQYVFRVGFFEFTDIVLNCVGATGGVLIALGGRKILGLNKK